MKLSIAGQAYEHPSRDINFQRCVNWFPTTSGETGQGPKPVLLPTPGLYQLVDTSGNQVRALMPYNNTIYAIVDATLYEITVNQNAKTATATSRGTINTTSGAISWASNPTQLMIVDGTDGYIYTPANTTLTEISDADFAGATMVVFMDSYFIINNPSSAILQASAVNDGTSWNALDVTTAEGKNDNLVGLAVDKRELWAFGRTTVEVYWDAANATAFPFSRREGAYIDQGCAAAESILNIDNSIMWLDDRGFVVRAEGYTPVIISTEAINHAIESYPTISDAYAYQHKEGGHLFYVLNFPSSGKTWAYDVFTKLWHERAYLSQDASLEHHLARNCVRVDGWNIVGARNSGKIYLMDRDYYDDAGQSIRRIRTTAPETMELSQIGIDSLELQLDAGQGLVTGQGSDPQIMMRYSHDGGYTWSSELWRSTGKIGEYDKRVRWNRLGSGREWIFEFAITDPIKCSLIDAYVNISGVGNA